MMIIRLPFFKGRRRTFVVRGIAKKRKELRDAVKRGFVELVNTKEKVNQFQDFGTEKSDLLTLTVETCLVLFSIPPTSLHPPDIRLYEVSLPSEGWFCW